MSQVKSKLGFPIAPEICQECLSGKHVMHIVDEMADFIIHVTTLTTMTGQVIENFIFSGYANGEDNFWLKRIIEFTREVTKKLPERTNE